MSFKFSSERLCASAFEEDTASVITTGKNPLFKASLTLDSIQISVAIPVKNKLDKFALGTINSKLVPMKILVVFLLSIISALSGSTIDRVSESGVRDDNFGRFFIRNFLAVDSQLSGSGEILVKKFVLFFT